MTIETGFEQEEEEQEPEEYPCKFEDVGNSQDRLAAILAKEEQEEQQEEGVGEFEDDGTRHEVRRSFICLVRNFTLQVGRHEPEPATFRSRCFRPVAAWRNRWAAGPLPCPRTTAGRAGWR